ncbi:MAG: DNA polymerase, partial [Patescibacteria group bacterium]
KILPFKKEALFSKKLATINCDVPLKAGAGEIEYTGFKRETLIPYLEKLGFESIIRRMNGGEIKGGTLNQESFTFEREIGVAWDWKPIIKRMIKNKKEIPSNLFDLGVAGWLLNSEETDFAPEILIQKFLKSGAEETSQETMKRLFYELEHRIKRDGLENVFYKIEMPLIPALAWLEIWGIQSDGEMLEKLGARMSEKISELTKKIYSMAGGPFNINSPRQVAEVIFERMKIRPVKNKRTSAGRRSTAEEVLLSLKDAHPIIPAILSYRETFKIKSTYAEPLLQFRDADKRIRTNFIQTGTATGRLASEKPNLQNIPQESEWAKDLRDTFVAAPGFSFASFDYAQLELRLLAHLTLEEKLLRAFEENQDIHALTASRVLKIPLNGVALPERRLGKTLNFGVVYGMGPRAFSQSAGVNLGEAKKFIDEYYLEFPKIKKWQDKIKAEAVSRGYVENLNGRRRWFWTGVQHPKMIGEIERAAINMPLQSLGADIIKMAMINSLEKLKERGWFNSQARLILTIHDELLFEIQDDILMETVPLIKKLMEEIYPLAVPLTAEVKTGKRWGSLQKYSSR